MEKRDCIRDLVQKYGRSIKPHEINISEYQGIVRRGILLATAKKENQDALICLPDAASFGQLLELWKSNFYEELELWFVANEHRASLACAFIKFYGREEEVMKNPLRFKGLDWGNDNYWVAIANDFRPSEQGELFPADKPTAVPLNVGDDKIFKQLRLAVNQGKIQNLTVFKIKKFQGDQFRLIYPWWIQRHLMQHLREESALTATSDRLESAG